MNEALMLNETAKQAEAVFKKYRKQVEAFEGGLVAKAVGVQPHHIVQLGKQLAMWEEYTKLMEANGSLNTLGDLPKVALDVVTATMSNSILPVIASTQAIEQQKGIIYFKNLRAENTKGNLTAGQKVIDPRTGMVTPKGYASSEIKGEIGALAVAGQTAYTFNVAGGPVRSQFMHITLEGQPSIFAEDVGVRGSDANIGTLLGAGVSGTVNYATGAVSLNFADAPTAGLKIFVSYQVNLEEATDVAKMTSFLDSTMIEAKPYALKSVIGIFQQFALKKQFGDSYLDDLTLDLTKEINAEVGGDMIAEYKSNFAGTAVTMSKTMPVGSAYTEKMYRENYSLRLADVEAKMIQASGRGAVKVMVVGRDHASFIRGLDGFQVLSDGASLGSHIFGTYKGIVFVRVPETAVLGADEGLALYSGATALESAGVYAPFMPLTMINKPTAGANPLLEQTVGATMAGIKVVVPAFIQKLDLTA